MADFIRQKSADRGSRSDICPWCLCGI